MADKNFINGIFVEKKTISGSNGTFEVFNISLSDDAIKALQALPTSPKGWRQLSMGAQKKDPSKYSVWQNDFVPTKKNGGTINNNTTEESSDDLPF